MEESSNYVMVFSLKQTKERHGNGQTAAGEDPQDPQNATLVSADLPLLVC